MGQYFRIVNLDKKEWIEPPSKLWELCANNEVRMLGYLLATNNPDGTSVIKWFDNPEEAKKQYGEGFTVIHYDKKYGHGYGRIKQEYFGHWCGDRIAVIGDYAPNYATNYTRDMPTFEELKESSEYKEITREVAEEFNLFIELEELKVENSKAISPDMVITDTGIHRNPKIRKKKS